MLTVDPVMVTRVTATTYPLLPAPGAEAVIVTVVPTAAAVYSGVEAYAVMLAAKSVAVCARLVLKLTTPEVTTTPLTVTCVTEPAAPVNRVTEPVALTAGVILFVTIEALKFASSVNR
jgi:hypothetical protein